MLVLAGEVDMTDAPLFELALETAEVDGEITLDMSGLDFIGSAGIRALVDQLRKGRALTIRHPSPVALRVLDVSGLGEMVEIVP